MQRAPPPSAASARLNGPVASKLQTREIVDCSRRQVQRRGEARRGEAHAKAKAKAQRGGAEAGPGPAPMGIFSLFSLQSCVLFCVAGWLPASDNLRAGYWRAPMSSMSLEALARLLATRPCGTKTLPE